MEGSNPVTQVVLPLAAAATLFALGLGLVPDDFRRVVRRPRGFLLGTLGHILLLPALAFAIAAVLPLRPTVAVGLLVIAACPANAASNVFTHLAGGDTMLSVCLTAATSLLAALTIPLVVNLALGIFMPGSAAVTLPLLPAVGGLFAVSTVPVVLGMVVRRRWPTVARAVERRTNAILVALIVILVAAVAISERSAIVPALGEAGLAALLLNAGAVVTGWLLATVARVERPQRLAIAFECGLQNFGLAAFVTLTLMGDARLLVPGIAYGLLMWTTAGVVVWLSRRRAAAR